MQHAQDPRIYEVEGMLEEHAAWMSVLRSRDADWFRINYLSDLTNLDLWLVGKLLTSPSCLRNMTNYKVNGELSIHPTIWVGKTAS